MASHHILTIQFSRPFIIVLWREASTFAHDQTSISLSHASTQPVQSNSLTIRVPHPRKF